MYSEIAIEVKNLSKTYQIYESPKDRLKQFFAPKIKKYFGIQTRQFYREFSAIKSANFSINKGDRIGIVGKNGSGKSTLLQIICGTLTPTEGSINTFGKVAALLELGSGFNPEFTGAENVRLSASLLGLSEQQISERYQDILDFADIGSFIGQPVKTYSSGMYVRLAFAVIAHVDAEILIIDEALAVGDVFFNQKCMRFMHEFSKKGTIVLVTHDTSAVTGFCNRAIWIDQGSIIKDGTTKEVCEAYLAATYQSVNPAHKTVEADDKSSESKERNLSSPKDSELLDEYEDSYEDTRQAFIDSSTLRNDIEIFKFRPAAASFGTKNVTVERVDLLNKEKKKVSWIVGGEIVSISIKALCLTEIDLPIVGFVVKDRQGQNLFGDNTYLSQLGNIVKKKQGEIIAAKFTFRMPILPAGDYVISIAVADGTQERHTVHSWIHDAVSFKSHSTSISTGLIGIPMKSIELS